MTGRKPKPDLLFVTLIHQALRVDADRLVTATSAVEPADAQRLAGLRVYFGEYREQLCQHHTHEDTLFFPALHAVVEVDQLPLAELAGQHQKLDCDLQAVSDGLASLADPSGDFAAVRTKVVNAMSGMADHLGSHLTLEEETVLPVMESALPPAAYKELEAQARKLTPRRRAQFLIPWLVAHASPGQRQALFKGTPPLRVAYLVSRHRYRLLDRALTS